MLRRARARAIAGGLLGVALCAAATGACLQAAGLNGYEAGDDGSSTDGAVGPSSDGGVSPGSDAMTAIDARVTSDGNAATSPPCVQNKDCASGTVCDTSSGRCAEDTSCPALAAGHCTTLPQCGCGAGTCAPERNGSNINQCGSAGTVAAGGECAAASCQLGFACYDLECLAFCDPKNVGTDAGCEGTETCLSVSTTSAVCAPTCTPTITCSGNCDFRSDFQGIPVCVPGDGAANVGDPCDNGPGTDTSTHCAPPLFCAPTMVCENPVFGSDPDCPDGSTYTSVYGLTFGYCRDGSN
jgi:hypothetical protein